MKRIVLYISLGLCSSLGAYSQHSLPLPQVQQEARLWYLTHIPNPMGTSHLLEGLPKLPKLSASYSKLLAQLSSEYTTQEEIIYHFLEHNPTSLDRQSAYLLLGRYYIDRNDLPRAIESLGRITPEGLSDSNERCQYQVSLAYALMAQARAKSQELSPNDIARAQHLLEGASENPSLWGEQALLYLCYTQWLKGDQSGALRILDSTQWDKRLAPEVAYSRAMLSFATQTPQKALLIAEQQCKQYPELKTRAGLQAAQGIANFRLGSYQSAVNLLSTLYDNASETLSPQESYALGASYYQLGAIKDARWSLEQAAQSPSSEAGALAQLLLGNIYMEQGEPQAALLAYTSATEHSTRPDIREYAIYNRIKADALAPMADFGQSVRLYEQYIREFPSSPRYSEVYNELAHKLITSRDYASSIDIIGKLHNPPSAIRTTLQYLLCKLAESRRGSSEHTLYLQTLSKAINMGDISPYFSTAYTMRAEEYLREKQYAQAEQDAQAATKQKGATPLAYYIEGYAAYNQHKYDKALNALRTFINQTTDPNLQSDAYLRIGDCLLQSKNKMSEALQAYREAAHISSSAQAEALHRIAYIYGRQGKYTDQIATIDQLLSDYPHSPIALEATYNKGKAQALNGQKSDALKTFSTLSTQSPNTQEGRLASLEYAMLSYNDGKTAEAIQTYKNLIARQPESQEAEVALSDLKNIYLAEDKVDEYARFLKTLGGRLTPSESETAQLNYLSAEKLYKRGDRIEAHEALEKFVVQYPHHPSSSKAILLLARLEREASRDTEAIKLLQKLQKPTTPIEIQAQGLEELASIYLYQNKQSEALKVNQNLFALSGISSNQHAHAGLALARLADQMGNSTLASETAKQTLEQLPKESAILRPELTLILGRSYEAQGKRAEADRQYKSLSSDTDSPVGAEAYVRSAELAYKAGQIQEAQQQIDALVSKGTPQQYWLARAFLLLSDCYSKQGQKYVAEQYLQSLQENYKKTDDGIQQMIEQRLTSLRKK